jgi:hypothetical protein
MVRRGAAREDCRVLTHYRDAAFGPQAPRVAFRPRPSCGQAKVPLTDSPNNLLPIAFYGARIHVYARGPGSSRAASMPSRGLGGSAPASVTKQREPIGAPIVISPHKREGINMRTTSSRAIARSFAAPAVEEPADVAFMSNLMMNAGIVAAAISLCSLLIYLAP